MKQGIVKFSKEFVTETGLKEWMGLEWDVDTPFDEVKAMEVFTKVKNFVCNYKSSNQGLFDNSYAPGPSTELPVINKAEERLGILIENASTKDELMNYKNDLSTPYLSNLFSAKLQNFKQ